MTIGIAKPSRVAVLPRPLNFTLALTTDADPANIDGLHAIRKEHPDLPAAWVIHEQHVTAAPVGTPIYDRIRFFDSTKLKAHLDWATSIGTVTPTTPLIKNLEDGHPGQPINGNDIRAVISAYQGALAGRVQTSYGLIKMDQWMDGSAYLAKGKTNTISADAAASPIIHRDAFALAECYLSRPSTGDDAAISPQAQTAWLLNGLARAMSLNAAPPAMIVQPWYHHPGKPWHATLVRDADIRIIRDVSHFRNTPVYFCAHIGPTSGGADASVIAEQVRRWRQVLG